MRMCRSLIRGFCRRDLQRGGSLVELWMVGGDSLDHSWIGLSGLGPNWFLGIEFRWDSDALQTLLGELAFRIVISYVLICDCARRRGLHAPED